MIFNFTLPNINLVITFKVWHFSKPISLLFNFYLSKEIFYPLLAKLQKFQVFKSIENSIKVEYLFNAIAPQELNYFLIIV